MCQFISAANCLQQKQVGGKRMVPLDKQLLIFLWYASLQETLRSMSDRFDVTESTVCISVRRVSTAIKEHLTPLLVKWPHGREKVNTVISGFENVLGAIDGTHIQISGQSFL